jgi:two-component system LytT family response regulator
VSADDPRKIRTLIVDDEPPARRNLALLLQKEPEIEIIGECGSGKDGVAAIHSLSPDLLFLDVQMPECDGFDVLEMLGSKAPAAIIFVTAYDQYALRAFDAGALDYLLKPFDNPRFERALARAKDKVRLSRHVPPKTDRLAIKSAGQVYFVKISEIDWIEADDYYACLHVGARNHLLRRTLTELEQDLDPALFCRIHRSAIVNIERIRTLKLNSDGEYNVVLENGSELRLSRGHRKDLQSRLSARSQIQC